LVEDAVGFLDLRARILGAAAHLLDDVARRRAFLPLCRDRGPVALGMGAFSWQETWQEAERLARDNRRRRGSFNRRRGGRNSQAPRDIAEPRCRRAPNPPRITAAPRTTTFSASSSSSRFTSSASASRPIFTGAAPAR